MAGATYEDSNATGMDGNQVNNSAQNSGAAYIFVRSDGIWSQQAYLKASNTEAEDRFGWSVDVSGDTVVVGAYQEASNATGINGNQTNNSAQYAGAAYVFSGFCGMNITDQPNLAGACAGGTATFGVASEGTGPLSYQWRRDTTPLADGPTGTGCTLSGTTTATLTIENVGADDAGSGYNCVVSNSCGSVTSNSAGLIVILFDAGDVNGDTLVDGDDVAAFVSSALSGKPDCTADMNLDGVVDELDVPLFAALLVEP